MRKIRLFICAIVVIAVFASAFIVGASANDPVSVWDGSSVTAGWYKNVSTLYINSAADFAAFIRSGQNFSGKTVVLNCNIVWNTGDASDWSPTNAPANAWTALSQFRGTFNGNGHYVSGVYYVGTGTAKVGFFQEIYGATVRNLSVINSYFCADQIAGGIAGMSRQNATISGVYVDAYVYSLTSTGQTGGLIGQAYGNGVDGAALTIENCEVHGVVSSDLGGNVGGLIGQAKGTNNNSTTQTLNLTVRNCLCTATVSGSTIVAGLVGRADYSDATFDSCYYKGALYASSSANIGGVIGFFGGDETYTDFTLLISKCFYDGEFWLGSGVTLSGFKSIPTRAGGIAIRSEVVTGSLDPSSTYYTDSDNDNSAEASGSLAALTFSPFGGLSAWLGVATDFTTDVYGNVRLTTLVPDHDHADYYGKWIADGTGQKHVCTFAGCMEQGTREASFAIAGASVRYDDPAGIRFLTRVNKNQFFKDIYTGDDNNYTYSGANITFGTLIVPKDMLDGELTASTPGVVNVVAKKVYNTGAYSQTSDYFYYTAVLVNFPESISTYNRDLAVRSYAMYEENEETVYIYTDTAVTSFYKVAEQVYPSQSQAVKEGLNMLLALGSVSDDFYSKIADRVEILEYASPELFNAFAASLESQGFTRHTNYEYSDNLFGLYYNSDYVVTFSYTPSTITNYVEPNQEWYAYGSSPTENMDRIINEFGVTVDDAQNIMRVIVEKRGSVDLPGTKAENVYERNENVRSSVGFIFPNDNYSHYGEGYIIQLADGSFIIIDGGENVTDPRVASEKTDADLLYDYLMAKKPAGHAKPVIAAWFISHRHNDHVDVIKGFAPKYKNDVVLEQIVYNFAAGVKSAPVVKRDAMRWADEYAGQYFTDAKIVTAHTGYKFYIRNAEISILFSIDDLYPFDITQVFTNNESIVFDVKIDGAQRLMFCNEVFVPGSRALVNMYGTDLASDVIQLSHHGHYGATEELYQLIWPASQNYASSKRFVLWPCGNEEQMRVRCGLAENRWILKQIGNDVGIPWQSEWDSQINYYMSAFYSTENARFRAIGNYLVNNSRFGFMRGNTIWDSKIYSMAQMIFESGTVTDRYNQTENTYVAGSGAIGAWKTIPLYYESPDYDTTAPWPWG